MKLHTYERKDGTRVEYHRDHRPGRMERHTINDARGETRIDEVEIAHPANRPGGWHGVLWDVLGRRQAEEEQRLDPLSTGRANESQSPAPAPALCPECGRNGFRTNANGMQECGNMACINFPYITSLNRAKWEALRAVSSARSSNESQSPEPLVAESVTKGSTPADVSSETPPPRFDKSKPFAVKPDRCPECRHASHQPGRCLNMASDSECNCGSSEGPRDASAPIDELKASKATPRQLREARVTGILAKVDNQVSRGMVAPHLDGADVLALASALREAREQLAQARSELDEEIRRSAAWAQEREDRHAAQWEQARRAVEQLKPDDIRLLHQFIEYSQTDYFYPEKNYPEWRDRVKAEGDSLVARIKGILSSPPQQSVSPTPEP